MAERIGAMPNTLLTRAAYAQRRLIGQLRRSEFTGAARLASLVEACSATRPCRSAACPVCGTAFQQAAVALVDHFIRVPARAIRSRMHELTVVPPTGCLNPEDLTAETCRRVATEITGALDTIGLPPSITGFEVSFNEDRTGEVEPHWCAHTHSVGLDWLANTQKKALRAIFLPSRLVKRPVHVELLDQNVQGRLYPFKTERVRRETYLNDSDPDRAPYRDTRRKALRPNQAASLALVDHELGFEGRLLIHGIDEAAVWRHLQGLGWARDGP